MPATVDGARSEPGRLRRTARTGRWQARRHVVAWVAAAVAVTVLALTIRGYGFADLAVYRGAVRSWAAGDGLYTYRSATGHLGFPLPPAAAFLLLPTAVLPLATAGRLTVLAGLTALAPALLVPAGPVARRYGLRRRVAVCVAAALAVATEPVRAAIGLGDLDLLLFGLVIADVVALRRQASARTGAGRWTGRSVHATRVWAARVWATGAWAGVGTGLATAMGLSPLVFIAYFSVTRQWRAAATAAGTALTVGGAALVVAPQTGAWFTEVLGRIDRTGPVDATANQSLAGILARLYDSATTPVLLWLSFSMLLLAVGLIRAKSAHGDGDEIAAFTLTGLTGAAIGPVTETHELIWVLPALLILVDAAAQRRRDARLGEPLGRRPRMAWSAGTGHAAGAGLGYLLFVAAPVWAYEHRLPETSHHADGLLGALGENSYGLALVLLVTALPWRPGTAPAVPGHFRTPAVRRPIPPARRPSEVRGS